MSNNFWECTYNKYNQNYVIMAIRENKLFVIKEADTGAYIFLHSDKKDVSPEFNILENAMKFTKDEVQFIYDNFKSVWDRDKYKVYELKMTEVRNFNWYL